MIFAVAPFAGAWIEIEKGNISKKPENGVAPFAGAWIEIWVSQAEFARSGIVFDFGDSSAQAEAAKKMEKYVQDNSFKGISQTTNILETRYIPNTPPVSEEPAGDRS